MPKNDKDNKDFFIDDEKDFFIEDDPLIGFSLDALNVAINKSVKFGTQAYLFSVWQYLKLLPKYNKMSWGDFAKKIMEAMRLGYVVLQRADLVGAMDRDLILKSEIIWGPGEFHMLETNPPK